MHRCRTKLLIFKNKTKKLLAPNISTVVYDKLVQESVIEHKKSDTQHL